MKLPAFIVLTYVEKSELNRQIAFCGHMENALFGVKKKNLLKAVKLMKEE
jgi:hypothetical protein